MIVFSLIYGEICVDSNLHIKMLAYDGTQMVLIEQPFIWR